MGEFDDVWAIAAGTGSSFDVFLLDVTNDGRWVANLSAVPSAVPVTAAAPLLLAGLGALGLFARRRKA